MIQANELRIGNYIHLDDVGLIKVSFSVFEALNVFPNTNTYRPIPLTPEILEKCGFKKYSHELGYAIGSDEINERCDEYTLGKITLMDWGDGFTLSNSFSFDLRVEVHSLHQLQNLVFALTQTELPITL